MLDEAKRCRYGSLIAGSCAPVMTGTVISPEPVLARMPSVTL